jgi:hypothetical protein
VPTNTNGVLDLQRNTDGTAVIPDPRNDENQITSQLMLAYLLFHNKIADANPSWKFTRVQNTVIQYHQWIIYKQFMPLLFGQSVIDELNAGKRRFYDPGQFVARPVMPVEFSTAAYRFGHSMVRNAYSLNPTLSPNNTPSRNTLFTGVGGALGQSGGGLVADLHGGQPLAADHVIDWGNFANELYDSSKPGQSLQVFKSIGADGLHMIGQSMFGQPPGTKLLGTGAGLPIGTQPGDAQPSGSNSIAYRDLIRQFFYLLPSGQDVAAAYGFTPASPTTVIDPSTVPGFSSGTPLWFYIMWEAQNQNAGGPTTNDFDNTGTAGDLQNVALGPVGAHINADVFLRILQLDNRGILDGSFSPAPPIAPTPGQFGIADLLVYSGQASYPASASATPTPTPS